ncbi:glycosyltransferase [Anoxybacillus geothermalis]|nr:glycosyltransferase [Anoxybacillus geothermalis]
MNDKKIAFIYCVNNRELYEESVRYVRSLYVPEGYKIEIITIEGAKSITSGYNEAMKKTDAKYKVYLHQDVFIVNKNFLYDIIALFEKYPKLGMIGVVGAKTIPRNGIWWESTQRFGKVYDSHTGEMKLLSFKETELEYEPVQAINGLIMITQYDIPWREDLFTGWHFYDLSECQEFLLAGYDVGVVRQNEPWCVHDCGIASAENGFDNDRKKFVDVYGKNVQRLNKTFLPLVSILIPTYNRPHYFELALQSALNQTYENIEVIVCDDSTNDETEKLVKKYTAKYNNLTYIKNPTRLGQFENDIKLFNLANGEYINYLMDDDLFHPQKIEKMMSYFIDDVNKEIKLVTSNRKMIDQNGEQLPDNILTQPLFEEDKVISGTDLGNLVLKYNFNCIGEPTTVLFRKSDLKEPFGTFLGRKYGCNVDIATWLTLLAEGKAVYVSQPLSYFRIHNSQQLQSTKMLLDGALDYAHEVLYARKKGFLEKKEDYLIALNSCEKYLSKVIEQLKNETSKDHDKFEELLSVYKKLILEIETVGKQSNNNIVVNENYPLVSVLIPAYNRPHYLELALQSALNQTYKNIEVIVCDDSTDDGVKDVVSRYMKSRTNIKYVKNEIRLKNRNVDRCLELARGEYINFLLDDDLFHPEKISKMLNYFINYDDISLVTSYRQTIDENGNKIDIGTLSTKKLFETDTILDGKSLLAFLLRSCSNVIGELTTVLFKKRDIKDGIAVFENYEYQNLQDVTLWIKLLSKGKAVYIAEPLSFFRVHSNQNAKNPNVLYHGIKEWYMLINYGKVKGFLDEESLVEALVNYLSMIVIPSLKVLRKNKKEIEYMKNEIEEIVLSSLHEIFRLNSICE